MQVTRFDNVVYYDRDTRNFECGHVGESTDAYADVFTAHANTVRVLLSDIHAIADTEIRAIACRNGIREGYGYPR